jgi:hypothetical protein
MFWHRASVRLIIIVAPIVAALTVLAIDTTCAPCRPYTELMIKGVEAGVIAFDLTVLGEKPEPQHTPSHLLPNPSPAAPPKDLYKYNGSTELNPYKYNWHPTVNPHAFDWLKHDSTQDPLTRYKYIAPYGDQNPSPAASPGGTTP